MDEVYFGPPGERERRKMLGMMARTWPGPDHELPDNLGLFLTPAYLSRILFFNYLWSLINEVQGVVMEFGCRWGPNLGILTALRGIYEPYNRLRRIVGFDTFAGMTEPSPQDEGGRMEQGAYAVTPDWERTLWKLLSLISQESPLGHLEGFGLVKGDVTETLPVWLAGNPSAVVALAYFDTDLYKPTSDCLRAMGDRLTRGSVLAFDNLNCPEAPGETMALREWAFSSAPIRRWPWCGRTSYLVVE